MDSRKALEDLAVGIGRIDAAIGALHDEAYAFMKRHSDGAADSAGVYTFFYRDEGRKRVLPALEALLAELQALDPERTHADVWAEALQSKAIYHYNFAAQVHELERYFEEACERVPSPFASSDTEADFRAALDAYEQVAHLEGTSGARHLASIGELRWRLKNRRAAAADLQAFLEHSDNSTKRLAARQLLAQIAEYDDARVARIGKREGAAGSSACIIATACVGADAPEIAALRGARDRSITADPVARDFFHVFWSRYYEWSPSVARLAEADPSLREHLRWGFLEPWLGWLEFVARTGRQPLETLGAEERDALLRRLVERRDAWLAELPGRLESKRPADAEVFAAFERFRGLVAEAWAGLDGSRDDPHRERA
ncbi:hypothetical protein [Anaeromyxobacter sp. PSR-1]|uniref:hypothetical protein n=1 Tax=unclassified Anaeromyxobacter TaxID=2620896 RepID=UPI0005E215D7|nr:hypothetical protein [Anaeromyxobacter sp. PSR-1]GAO01760.1 hypothetical protein PSR1_00620 [Anaeromyxobacter sp. PSR-1]